MENKEMSEPNIVHILGVQMYKQLNMSYVSKYSTKHVS